MTSQIDVTVPVYGNPRTEDERKNWQTASNEITLLQSAVESIRIGDGVVRSVAERDGDVVLAHGDITDWTQATANFYLTTNPAHYQSDTDVASSLLAIQGHLAPLMDGAPLIGTAARYAREDHVHPSDTSRYAVTNPANYQTDTQVATSLAGLIGSSLPLMDGTAAAGAAARYSREDHTHPVDTSRYAASNPSNYQNATQVALSVSSGVASYIPLAQRAAPSGVATLDINGLLTTSQLPSIATGTLSYQGVWNPVTNTNPTLATGGLVNGAASTKGQYWVCSVGGTSTAIDGVTTWAAGDWASSSGTKWERVQVSTGFGTMASQNASAVSITGGSIAGQTQLGLSTGDLWRSVPTTPDFAWYFRDASGNIPLALDLTGGLLGLSATFSGTLAVTGAATFSGAVTAASLVVPSLTAPIATFPAVTALTLTLVPDVVPDIFGQVFDSSGNIASYYDTTGTFNFLEGYTPKLTADLLVAGAFNITGSFSAGTITVTQANMQIGSFTLPTAPEIPDVVFPFFDSAGNIIAYFGTDATFHAVQLDAATITQNGAPVGGGGTGASDSIDISVPPYSAVGDAVENLCYVSIIKGTPNLTDAYNFSGNITLAQTTPTTATVTIASIEATGVAFQPYNVGQWLYLKTDAYSIQAQVINYIDGSNVVISASGISPFADTAGKVLCPSFTPDRVGKILLVDGLGQNIWWSGINTPAVTWHYDTRPPNGVTAFMTTIVTVVGPDSIVVATTFPYGIAGLPGYLIWGTNDCPAVVLAGQDAVKTNKRKLHFSGNGKKYFLPGIVRAGGGEPTYIPQTYLSSGAMVGTLWTSDNARVLGYSSGGYPQPKNAGRLGSSTGKWAPRSIFGRTSFPRCNKLTSINVLITGDSLGTYNAQAQSSLFQQSRLFVEQFKRANPTKTINFYNIAVGGATYASLTDPTTIYNGLGTETTGGTPAWTVPKPFSNKHWLDFYANINQTGVGPAIVPDLVVIMDCGGNDSQMMDCAAIWYLINTIRKVVHDDGLGQTDILMQTDRITNSTTYTSGNDGGVAFPASLNWYADYSTDLIRSTALANGIGCIDLQPLGDKATMGIDTMSQNLRTAPSFNKLAATPTDPLVFPFRQRDFSFVMTLPGNNDNVIWPAMGGLDIQISKNPGNRLMMRFGTNGHLWLGVATYGETTSTVCTIAAGSKSLTVGPPISYTGQIINTNTWPQVSTSGSIFDTSMEGKTLVAPLGHRQGNTVQLSRNYIGSVLQPTDVIVRDMPISDLTDQAATILIGGTIFIPQDGTSTPDVTIFYPDGTIWNTKLALGGYVSSTQATLVDAAPQALSVQTVPVHIGRMCVKWHDTGYVFGPQNNPLAIEFSRHTLLVGSLYKGTTQVNYINEWMVERWGKEFYPVIRPVQGSQDINLGNIWISEPKPYMPTATVWELRGIRDVNSDGWLGGVGGHSASPLRTEVVDPFYANQDLTTA